MDMSSLLFGFLLGIITISLSLFVIMYFSNKRFLRQMLNETNVDNTDIKTLLSKKQKRILTSKRIGFMNNLKLLTEETRSLIKEIAVYYYPESKHPEYEITIIEAIEMNQRVIERLRKILELKGFHLIQNIRVSQIIYLLEVKKNIENNTIYQFSRKYHLDKMIGYGITALNFANPAYWIRKVIFTSTLESTLRGMAILTLNIVSEEAKRLYSKKIEGNSDKILEKELQKFIKEIEASN